MTTSDELRRWADHLRKWAADTPISLAKAQMLIRAAEFEEEAREKDAKPKRHVKALPERSDGEAAVVATAVSGASYDLI